MSNFRVASRYAKSLLELAVEKGVLEEVHNDMVSFSKVCDENRDFALMLKNPIIKHDKKRTILTKVFEGKVNAISMAIFDLITKKNRESVLPEIAKEFHTQYNFHKSIQLAKVVTAVPLDKDLKSRVEEIVNQISVFDKVELKEEVNKDIIGGFVLTVGDKQIDDSLKSKLKALELKFSQNPYIKEF